VTEQRILRCYIFKAVNTTTFTRAPSEHEEYYIDDSV